MRIMRQLSYLVISRLSYLSCYTIKKQRPKPAKSKGYNRPKAKAETGSPEPLLASRVELVRCLALLASECL